MSQNFTIKTAIQMIEDSVEDPMVGLPEEIFYLISRFTAMVNVDLLIKDKDNRVLLSWRDTEFSGAGWHVPGGIIRFKESLQERIQEVALTELGTEVGYNPILVAINQIEKRHATRGHFISFLYNCTVADDFSPDNANLKPTDAGYLQWHEDCPDKLVKVHDRLYRKIINMPLEDQFNGRIPYQKIDE